MKDKVKRILNYRFDRYKEMEIKLEKLAAKGLFLEEYGVFMGTFRIGEPKKLKYTVTFFSEGSVFNPDYTENQQTYFEYAKAAGWEFVTQWNQMQIFCNEADQPIPFETDEKEKFNNIKRCTNKSFLPSVIILVFLFLFNLVMQYQSFRLNPIDYLSDPLRLLSGFMIVMVVLCELYTLLAYAIWCRRSERSIARGGGCAENRTILCKIVECIFFCVIFGSLGCCFLYLIKEINWFGLFLSLVQIPILMVVFGSSIRYLRRKKASALMNKVISIALLTIANFVYLALIMVFIIKFGFQMGGDSDYRTIDWQVSTTGSHEFRLYSDEIPLTCKDLYGEIDYDYYSYEKEINHTVFLTKSNYRQDALPAKDAPPGMDYEIIETKYQYVYQLAKEKLLEIPEWRTNQSLEPMDNEVFGTIEAYQEYYEGAPQGNYILLFEDRILTINMENEPTIEQIAMIKRKLQL